MAASILIHLPPGALHAADFALLLVDWWRVSSPAGQTFSDEKGRVALGELLAQLKEPVTLVLSAADVHLSRIELTRQQARHLDQVLPYLLEEKVIDEPDALLSVASKPKNGSCQLAAVNRQALDTLMVFVKNAGVSVEQLLVDGVLLASHAPCVWPVADSMLVVSEQTALVLPAAHVTTMLEGAEAATVLDDDVAHQLLTQAATNKPLDLMQSRWRSNRKDKASSAERSRWQATLSVAAILLVALCISQAVQYARYNAAAKHWQLQSTSLFEQLFPGDKATLRLRSQFQGHLTRLSQTSNSEANFVSLMTRVGDVAAAQKNQGTVIERIQFEQQNGQLMLDVEAASYDALQNFRDALQTRQLKAEINVAKTNDKKVTARFRVEQSS